MLVHNTLALYYQNVFALAQHYKYQISEIENIIPYERDIYLDMLLQFIEDSKQQEKNAM